MNGVQIYYEKNRPEKFYIRPEQASLINPQCSASVAEFLRSLSQWANHEPVPTWFVVVRLVCLVAAIICLDIQETSKNKDLDIVFWLLMLVWCILFFGGIIRRKNHRTMIDLILDRFQSELLHFYVIQKMIPTEHISEMSCAVVLVLAPVTQNQGFVQPIYVVNQPQGVVNYPPQPAPFQPQGNNPQARLNDLTSPLITDGSNQLGR